MNRTGSGWSRRKAGWHRVVIDFCTNVTQSVPLVTDWLDGGFHQKSSEELENESD
jgi:hypothetical protein